MKVIKILFYMFMLIVFTMCNEDNYDIDDPDYSIGEIFYYTPAFWMKTRATVNYTFQVGSKIYNNQYESGAWDRSVPTDANYKEGDKFMVKYSKSKPDCPQCNYMLFNYPVRDSTDYLKYIEEFKESTPW